MQGSGTEQSCDPFRDDLSLLIETGDGPVVLFGCAHTGIVEILEYISSGTGHRDFYAVIGGTHLNAAPDHYIQETIETLRERNVRIIGVSHCTGFGPACRIAAAFPDRFRQAATGSEFVFN